MFHLAFPVINLEQTVEFYTDVLGAEIGRSGPHWIDFNWAGNQITVHENKNLNRVRTVIGSEGIPVQHFGIILSIKEWEKMKQKIISLGVPLMVTPHVVFPGKNGEQHTFFVEDPSGYAIEIKGFEDLEKVFLENEA